MRRALRRVRLIIGLGAVVLALHALQRSAGVAASVGLACGAVVLATIVGEAGLRRTFGSVRASMVMVTADLAMTIAVLGLTEVHPGDPASLLLVLPLIQAGVRHGVLGAFVTWFAASLAVFAQLTAEWDGTPGQVAGPMSFAVGLLLISLPTASLSDHLAERMHSLTSTRASVDARADVLADVLEASVSVARVAPEFRRATVLDHARRLVAGHVEFAAFDPSTDSTVGPTSRSVGDRHDAGTALRLPIGGVPPMFLSIDTDERLDPFTIEALELLALTARSLGDQPAAGTPATAADPDATVERTRIALEATTTERRRRTDAHDRRSIEHTLDRQLNAAAAGTTQIALVSLDNLKLLNDLYGFASGDALIRATAERLSTIDRAAEVFWLGGEEFLVVAGMNEVGKSLRLAIRRALGGRVELGAAGRTTIHSGVGVAVATEGETAAQLVRRARESMFADKRQQNQTFLTRVETELAGHLTGTA